MLTGRRFHVLEQQGSQGLNPGDVYFTRVVTAGGISLMFGAAPYVFPARFQIDALDWRDLLFGRRKRARKDPDKFEAEILDCYHVFAERLLNPTIPKLRNTDGDELAPTSITYGLTIPIPEAFTRLLPLATLGVEEHVSDVVEDADGVMTSAVLQWVKSGNRKMKQWDNTILGSLHNVGTSTVPSR